MYVVSCSCVVVLACTPICFGAGFDFWQLLEPNFRILQRMEEISMQSFYSTYIQDCTLQEVHISHFPHV